MSRLLVPLAAAIAILAQSRPAPADIMPPDNCAAAGESCTTAGADFKQPGTCIARKCTKTALIPRDGAREYTYDCNTCVATAPSAAPSSRASAASTPASAPTKSGCSASPGAPSSRRGLLGLAVGLMAALTLRRSRRER